MIESELERILVEEVRKAGGRAYKWVSPGNDGVPDRIVFMPQGRQYLVELKTDRGKVSAQQKIQQKRLTDLGQIVCIVRGIEGLIGFMQVELGLKVRADYLKQKYLNGGGGSDEVHTT